MAKYWIVGGEYETTAFDAPVGGSEERHGPFADYEAAKAEWQRMAWSTVDDCMIRYRIEKAES